MRIVGRLLVALSFPLGLIALVGVGVVLAVDQAPMIRNGGSLTSTDMRRAKALLERYDPRKMVPHRITTVTASDDEINTALSAAFPKGSGVSGRVVASQYGVLIGLSAELPIPPNPLGRFINTRATIAESPNGLEVRRFAIGGIEVPGGIAEIGLRLTLDHFLGSGKGAEIIESIKATKIAGNQIALTFKPLPTLVSDITTAARDALRVSNAETVRTYYVRLIEIAERSRARRGSLTAYIGPLFALAQDRSRNGDPVDENRAAVLALSIYFGDPRIERFIGEVVTDRLKARTARRPKVLLGGRKDYAQHFVISAGLALTGGTGFANVVGEAKEVFDQTGGSGFSFTDIAADRAGVRFAKTAVASAAAARRVQEILSGSPSEGDFFPPVRGLPEGLTRQQFEARFRDIDSRAYRRMVEEIDRRIDRAPLFAGAKQS